MNIDQIPAGRELDVLVAERVMGKQVYRHAGSHEACFCQIEGDDDISICHGPIPQYSTDISAAWEVVEVIHKLAPKLAKDGCWGSVCFMLVKDEDGLGWDAGIADTFVSCLEGVNGFGIIPLTYPPTNVKIRPHLGDGRWSVRGSK